MKQIIKKICKLVIYLTSLIIRIIVPIRKGRVLIWATVGKDYGCNPMYISRYIVNYEKGLDVWWMFLKGYSPKSISKNEKIVIFRSLRYLYIINTAEYIITNHRSRPLDYYWKKRKGQKYIMTWHGSMPIKMVEKDAIESIGSDYVKMAKADSDICDLMISDSEFFTNLIRQSFWYTGEILKTSIPRNQKFYEKENYKKVRSNVLSFFGENPDNESLIVLYAPTFRQNHKIESYITDWTEIKTFLEKKFSKPVIILMRLHPNLLGVIDTDKLLTGDYIKNASVYNDMQELMVASDILITDYSSTMFEFSMMQKPCFLYMPDKDTYDRGLYFKLSDLPFEQSQTIPELLDDIDKCDVPKYINKIEEFIATNFKLYEPSNGSVNVVEWMKNHSLKN